MKTLITLLKEQADVEARIRSHRVHTIRRFWNNVNPDLRRHGKSAELLKMLEDEIHNVYYSHRVVDDLLDQIEIHLGLEPA